MGGEWKLPHLGIKGPRDRPRSASRVEKQG